MVVDPDNPTEKGFPFVVVPNWEQGGKRLLVSAPIFAVLSDVSQMSYSLRHRQSEWNHGAEPLKGPRGGPPAFPDVKIKGMIRYNIEFGMGTSSYIPNCALTSITAEFYAALDEVRPPVPEAALRPSAQIVSHLGDSDLLRIAVNYAHSTVSRFALDALSRRRIGVSALANRLLEICDNAAEDHGRQNEARVSGAIAAIAYFIRAQDRHAGKGEGAIGRTVSTDLGIAAQGFLCDRSDLWVEQPSSNELLSRAAEFLTKRSTLPYATELLKTPGFRAKFPRFVVTPEAEERLDEACYALRAGIPLLIQGPTSASKSVTAHVATIGLFGDPPLVYALSEQTEVADLLGRKLLRRSGTALLSFVPGVLSQAYRDGRVLLLDEFDLCSPKVLVCILAALDGSVIEINGGQIQRHPNFRLIATLNGETAGFTSKQRNVLPAEILARFRTISFAGLSREECNRIFAQLTPKSIGQPGTVAQCIADLHASVQSHFSDQTAGHRDFTRGEAAMTLRNFNCAMALMEFGHCTARDASTIAYLAQLPRNERTTFQPRMQPFGSKTSLEVIQREVRSTATRLRVHPHEEFLDAAVNAVVAARSGLHVLLEGPSGAGLTTLARFVAICCVGLPDGASALPDIPRVLLGQESTVDNIIGAFRPQSLSGDHEDITKLVQWEDGPLLDAAQRGIPVLLDRVDEAKAQVTERLNPVLEKNARLGPTKFLVPEKGESPELDVKVGFVVIATLTINPRRQGPAVSLALRNRFVTIAVEAPVLVVPLREKIAQMAITSVSDHLASIDLSSLSSWAIPKVPDPSAVQDLVRVIGQAVPETATVRDIALLSRAARSVFGVIECKSCESHVQTCRLVPEELASEAVETLVHRTVNDGVPGQRFFFKGDRKAPMWQSMAALSVSSATGVPLFLQGAPGCGKTEAVRHFSSNRTFHDRTPVYSVSCSAETSIEQFIGSQVFEKGGFQFVEGPLIQAAKEGCVFLADEFNLLSPNVMIALIPFLEARVGDEFTHPDVRDQIRIAPGFLFVATGNEDTERGRVRLPDFVMSQLRRLEVANPCRADMEHLIGKIIEADYPKAKVMGVTPGGIRTFVETLKTVLNVTWSLRTVRRFLRRLNDFAGFRPADGSLPDSVQEITVADVALSFLLSLPARSFDEDRYDRMIKETVACFGGSSASAIAFARSPTQYRECYGNHYLVRSHIALPVNKAAEFPQPFLDTLFWARWCGTPHGESLVESMLLVGPTSYKSLALEYLMPKSTSVYDMTRETQLNELIGSTILSSSARIREDTDHLRHAVSVVMAERTTFDMNRPGLGGLGTELGNEFRRCTAASAGDTKSSEEIGVLRGSSFVHLCLERMMLDNQHCPQDAGRVRIPIVMCFSPSVVTKSALLGIPLVLRSVHLPPASVLERLNSLLEDPRSLVLGEDTQRVFSNPEVIRMVTGSNSRSIPICPGFSIAGTTTEAGFVGLSGPLQSRFTYVTASPYSVVIPQSPGGGQSHSDFQKVALTVFDGNGELVEAIGAIYRELFYRGRVNVGITEYVRWCMTTLSLLRDGGLSPRRAAGIAALRTIVDALSDGDRRRVTKDVLASHLLTALLFLVVMNSEETPVFSWPVELYGDGGSRSRFLPSPISEIRLLAGPNAFLDVLASVVWTQSTLDMAHAVFTAVAAGAMAIFEGSPGRGKTAVAAAILRSLGLQCTRINLSPTTSAEDRFGRDIPQSVPEGGFVTRFVPGPLTLAM
jgi:MoxR-like ATPase